MWKYCLLFFMIWNGEKVSRSEGEWRKQLGQERFFVMRQKGTERPFLKACPEKKEAYLCAACELPLFLAKDHYDLKNGWPSFSRPIFFRTA